MLESHKEFYKKSKSQKKKRTLYHYLDRQDEAYKDSKEKCLIDFDEDVGSAKSLAVKKESKINLTTRFLNGKILMFRKKSIQSFVYDLIDVFMYSNEEISKIYKKHEIKKCFLYQNLTDTDRTSVFFVFICKITCAIDEKDSRDIIFEVLTKSKILERLDVSDDFWKRFDVQDKSKKNKSVYMKWKTSITRIF